MRFIGRRAIWEQAQADGVFDRMLSHWDDRGFGWRSAVDRTTGAWLGFVGLNVVGPGVGDIAADEVEIGWWIVRPAWGHGYATEGAAAVRDEGFNDLGLDRLIARVQSGNSASARVAEKLEMRLGRAATGRSGEELEIYHLERGVA
jgi:RimJ/RimL family protein N-acetyltransferase